MSESQRKEEIVSTEVKQREHENDELVELIKLRSAKIPESLENFFKDTHK